MCAGPLSSPGFAGVDVPALMQAIPPEPPLLGLVALLLKMTQVTHQVLGLLLAGALWLLQAPADLTQLLLRMPSIKLSVCFLFFHAIHPLRCC